MSPILLHIYGPFAIHSFGVMIVIGLIITLYLLSHDHPLQKLITNDQLATIIQISFFAGIIGGRIWFLITNPATINTWIDLFSVWSGGLSILGALISIPTTLTVYFYYKKLPALATLDRLALYAPILQAISRFGCFFAGCCYGKPTTLPWAVIYHHPDSLAPLHIFMHPTQLYSTIFLICSFIILFSFNKYYHKEPGQIVALYIMLISLDRFCIDFFRGDQEFFVNQRFFKSLSIQQNLALCLFMLSFMVMLYVTYYTKPIKNYCNFIK